MSMKTYAADNLLFLREQYPEIYRFIRNRSPLTPRFQREDAKNGLANLVIREEGRPPQYLYSRYDPALEAERWVQSLEDDLREAGDILVVGFGLGYHAAVLLREYPDKRFYIYEPDAELLAQAVEMVDLRPILSQRQIVSFAVGDEGAVLSDLLRELLRVAQDKFSYLILPFCKRLRPSLETRINELIRRIARGFGIDLNTIARFKTEWIENLIDNMERNLRTPSFYALKDACKEIPAVICGSGPSLQMVADTLREVRRHALIIAAGTSVQGLLHHGIKPHLVVSLDSSEANKRAFEDLNLDLIPFLYIPTMKYAAIPDHPYLMHGFFQQDVISHYLMNLTTEDGVLASTATVTGMAIQLAVHMGCPEIVLIGQDFSFPDHRIYSAGVDHVTADELQMRLRNAQLAVENVNGGMNPTSLDMLHLKADVEQLIAIFEDIPFYNASPVGAVIENTKPIKLEEWLRQKKTRSVPDDWLKEQMRQRLRPMSPKRVEKIKRRIRDMRDELRDLEKALQELHEHITGNVRPNELWFIRFEALWSRVVGHELYRKVFFFFLAREHLAAERQWKDMQREADREHKFQMLLKCAAPLVVELRRLVPFTEERLADLSVKLEGKKSAASIAGSEN